MFDHIQKHRNEIKSRIVGTYKDQVLQNQVEELEKGGDIDTGSMSGTSEMGIEASESDKKVKKADDSTGVQLSEEDEMKKAMGTANTPGAKETIEKGKGGEGSKGGKVIGHTKSGKPIYDTFSHSSHASFTKQDHRDASALHQKLTMDHIDKHNKAEAASDERKAHLKASSHHSDQEEAHHNAVVDAHRLESKKTHKKRGFDEGKGDEDVTGKVEKIKKSDLPSQTEDIRKSRILDIYGSREEVEELIKSGEGSRGGKVIGHTKSGKPIYQSSTDSGHQHFTKEDHEEAAALHNKEAEKHLDKYNKAEAGSSKRENALKMHQQHTDHAANHKRFSKKANKIERAKDDKKAEHPVHAAVDKYLSRFPDNAKGWEHATDEVRDLARSAKEYHNEMDKDLPEDHPNAHPALNFREMKTPSEWNTKGKAYIKETLGKMSDRAKSAFMERHSHWLTPEKHKVEKGQNDELNSAFETLGL